MHQEILAAITSMGKKQQKEAIKWMGRQAQEVQCEIMRGRYHLFKKLTKQNDLPGHVLDYAALVLSCAKEGFLDEQRYRSSSTLTSKAQKGIARRRLARAKENTARLAKVREALAVNWGQVVELRRQKISFRGIAATFSQEHGISVSHATIHKHWKRWEHDAKLPIA